MSAVNSINQKWEIPLSDAQAKAFNPETQTTVNRILQKYLQRIKVREVKDVADISQLNELRELRHYAGNYCHTPGTVCFLAVDEYENALGTLQLTNSRESKPDIENYISLENILEENHYPIVQIRRLIFNENANQNLVVLALLKAVIQYCQIQKIDTVLTYCPSETGRNLFMPLLFEDTGTNGYYYHPLRKKELFRTYLFSLSKSKPSIEKSEGPLSLLF